MKTPIVFASGQRFGRLTIVGPAGHGSRGTLWTCRCDCGVTVVHETGALNTGNTRSCGCLHRDTARARAIVNGRASTTHGQSWLDNRSLTYSTWNSMKSRCQNPNNDKFWRYGAKGITVCDAWQDYEVFLRDMGPRPKGKSLDRIDGTKGYEPTNCRWATPREQRANQGPRRRMFTTIDGQSLRFVDVAKYLAMSLHSCRVKFRQAGVC